MASRLFSAAAAVSSSSSSSSPSLLACSITRHGRRVHGFEGRYPYDRKVNLWEDPKNPKRWKVNHFIAATWAVWGVCVYGWFKLFDGEKKAEVSAASSKRE